MPHRNEGAPDKLRILRLTVNLNLLRLIHKLIMCANAVNVSLCSEGPTGLVELGQVQGCRLASSGEAKHGSYPTPPAENGPKVAEGYM